MIKQTNHVPKLFTLATLFLSTHCFANPAANPATVKATYKTDNLKGITPTVLKSAVNAYEYAINHNDVKDKSILTIVNFNEPSYERRMWVIDTNTGDIKMAMHVAQGKNTGFVKAKHFSNKPGTDESSPGIYTTLNEYTGKHGKSMRIKGLEPGINSNAEQRAIVIHPAWYVKPSFIERHGYAGRSWGCFAVNPSRLSTFLDAIQDQSVLFAYAPSENNDPNVNHALSDKGRALYQKIASQLSNTPKTFLSKVETDITKTV